MPNMDTHMNMHLHLHLHLHYLHMQKFITWMSHMHMHTHMLHMQMHEAQTIPHHLHMHDAQPKSAWRQRLSLHAPGNLVQETLMVECMLPMQKWSSTNLLLLLGTKAPTL